MITFDNFWLKNINFTFIILHLVSFSQPVKTMQRQLCLGCTILFQLDLNQLPIGLFRSLIYIQQLHRPSCSSNLWFQHFVITSYSLRCSQIIPSSMHSSNDNHSMDLSMAPWIIVNLCSIFFIVVHISHVYYGTGRIGAIAEIRITTYLIIWHMQENNNLKFCW